MKRRTRRIKRRKTRRRQRGGVVVTNYLGGMPVANKRHPTVVFRSVDEGDPHGSSSASFYLPEAFERSQEAGP